MKGYPLYPHIQHETLRDLVDWCAQKYRDEPAYAWMHKKQTETRLFSQVRRDVRSLCQYLLTDGSKTGHVALLGENSYSWIISYATELMEDQSVELMNGMHGCPERPSGDDRWRGFRVAK